MEIKILEPNGYCYGVEKAISTAEKIKKAYPNNNIYILGMLVHNEHVCKGLLDKGINTIDANPNDFESEIKKLSKNDILIFTAHGHDEKLNKICEQMGIKYFDAVCPMVKHTFSLIKNALRKKENVIYIGQVNHPEFVAATSINSNIKIIDSNKPIIPHISTKYPILCINQTTLNYKNLKFIHSILKKEYQEIEIVDEICGATRKRQESIELLDSSYDALIVVGSNKSSNTNKLKEIAKTSHPHMSVFMVSSADEIDLNLIKKCKKVAITGGTSTPFKVLQQVYELLDNLN